MVAVKYKKLVPVARQCQFEEKVQEISKKLSVAWNGKRRGESTVGDGKADAWHLLGVTGDGNGRVKYPVEHKI